MFGCVRSKAAGTITFFTFYNKNSLLNCISETRKCNEEVIKWQTALSRSSANVNKLTPTQIAWKDTNLWCTTSVVAWRDEMIASYRKLREEPIHTVLVEGISIRGAGGPSNSSTPRPRKRREEQREFGITGRRDFEWYRRPKLRRFDRGQIGCNFGYKDSSGVHPWRIRKVVGFKFCSKQENFLHFIPRHFDLNLSQNYSRREIKNEGRTRVLVRNSRAICITLFYTHFFSIYFFFFHGI